MHGDSEGDAIKDLEDTSNSSASLEKQPEYSGESKENVVRHESKESEDVVRRLVPGATSSTSKGDFLC
jgi:hypothetical protein